MLKYVKVIALYYKNIYICPIKLKKTIINNKKIKQNDNTYNFSSNFIYYLISRVYFRIDLINLANSKKNYYQYKRVNAYFSGSFY